MRSGRWWRPPPAPIGATGPPESAATVKPLARKRAAQSRLSRATGRMEPEDASLRPPQKPDRLSTRSAPGGRFEPKEVSPVLHG